MPEQEKPQHKQEPEQQSTTGQVTVKVRAPWAALKINDRLTLTNTPTPVEPAQVDKIRQVAARHRVPITVKEN